VDKVSSYCCYGCIHPAAFLVLTALAIVPVGAPSAASLTLDHPLALMLADARYPAFFACALWVLVLNGDVTPSRALLAPAPHTLALADTGIPAYTSLLSLYSLLVSERAPHECESHSCECALPALGAPLHPTPQLSLSPQSGYPRGGCPSRDAAAGLPHACIASLLPHNSDPSSDCHR